MEQARTAQPDSYPARFRRKTGLRRSDLVVAVVALVLLSLLTAVVVVTARRYRHDLRWTLHTYQVRERLLQLNGHVQVADKEARSYGLTGRDVSFREYWHAIGEVEHDTDALAAMVADNPAQLQDVAALRKAIATRREVFERILTDYRSQGAEAARADVIAQILKPSQPIRDVTDRMLQRETSLLATRTASSDRNGRNVAMAGAVALAGSFALLIVALYNVGYEQRRRFRKERELRDATQRLEQALREAGQAGETLRRLARLTELLQSCRDLGEAITVIERALPPLLSQTSGCLALINASRNIVEARMQWGTRGPELADAVFTPDDCWALRRSQPHPGPADATAPVCAHLVQSGVTASHTLCLPLSSQGQILGILCLCAHTPILLDMRQLATTVADQLALALGNLQLQASLRTQSIRDPLTNLFNRRYLEASLPRELVRAQRRQGGLSVLMFDIDHFKRYNDTQGHDAGDAVLDAFAALLAQSCRSEDIPCRFGGEEFTVVLTDANHENGLKRAEAIRVATAELVMHYRSGTLPPVTVSVGVASFPEHGDTPEVLLRMADQALYRAKQLGRNRVASAGDVAGTPIETRPAATRT